MAILDGMAPLMPLKPSSLQCRPKPNRVLKGLAGALLALCVVILAYSFASIVSTEANLSDQAQPGTSGSVVVESGATPSSDELAAADYLAGKGHRVRLLRRDPASPDPQPDAQLDDDDFPTEIKTVGNITSSDVSGRLAGRIREALGQAPSVVVDARKQAGLTIGDIERALERADGMAQADGKVVKRIRIIGPNGVDIVDDYTHNVR